MVPLPAPAARAEPIDALRGLAILGMVLVAAEPLGVLPAWMYHAQNPPPSHELNTGIAGLTWPDLVFPFFLFTLGAAIPLALARRLDRGAGYPAVVAGAVARGALLVFFALFRQHFDSTLSGLPPLQAWAIGLAGFGVLLLIFTRVPGPWPRPWRAAARAAGWTGAAALFAFVTFPDGTRFSPERIDIILLLLAYCALFGTLVWLATRRSLLARLGVLAVLAATRVVAYEPGWLNAVYEFSPAPWLYHFSFFQFLCAVIPGTIVGDLVADWMRSSAFVAYGAPAVRGWSAPRSASLALLLLLAVPLVLAGIQGRLVLLTTAAAAVLCGAAGWLARRPRSETESLIQALIGWGSFWLLLGLILDPYDGGTKKVPETFAWFFQGCGLAIFVLIGMMIVADRRGGRPLRLLVDAGQNPMIAYVALGMLVTPILGLTGVLDQVDALELGPPLALAWAAGLTLLVALATRLFTQHRWFWRT